jgi:hypothetical protein
MARWWPHLVLLAGFVLRAANLTGESLWRDEVDTIRFAFVGLDQLLGNLTRAQFNGPLYHLLMRGWLSLAGVDDLPLRYFSALCGALQLALYYALARRMFGPRVALAGLGLAAISPALAWYGGEGKMYTLQPMLIMLALYALLRALTSASGAPRRAPLGWWAIFVAAASAGFYVHLLTPLALAVAAAFALAWQRAARAHWRGLLIAFGLCTLPYVPLAVWQVPLALAGGDLGHAYYPLDVMALSLAYNWSIGLSGRLVFGLDPELGWLAIASFAALAALGAAAGLQSARRGATLAALAWLLAPALLVYLVSTRIAIFQPRYVLWSAPAYYLLVALGLRWLWRRATPLAIGIGAWLMLLSALGAASQIAIPIRPDLRGAAAYVGNRLGPADRLVFQIPYTRYAFEYYLPRFAPQYPVDSQPQPDDGLATLAGLRARIGDGPYTNPDLPDPDVEDAVRQAIGPGERIWYVEVEPQLWDARGAARAWFDANLALLDRRDFRGVQAGLYARPLDYDFHLPMVSRE